jgi:hypothetical protein
MPVIVASQEAEVRRITVRSQVVKYFSRPYLKKKKSQKRASGVTQGIGLEFKPQCHKKKNQKP